MVSSLAPQASASANSATPALCERIVSHGHPLWPRVGECQVGGSRWAVMGVCQRILAVGEIRLGRLMCDRRSAGGRTVEHERRLTCLDAAPRAWRRPTGTRPGRRTTPLAAARHPRVRAGAAFPVAVADRLPHWSCSNLLDVHSRYGLRTRRVAEPTRFLGGFDGFVTSTTAPIASVSSDESEAGWDLHPLKSQTFSRRTLNSALRSEDHRARRQLRNEVIDPF